MRQSEEGAGRLKTLIALAFLGAVAFVAIKVIPVYVNNFELQDHIQQLSIQLAVRIPPPLVDDVRRETAAYAQDLGIPLTIDNVAVTVAGHVSINVDYTVPVDLKVYTLMLHFRPSAESRAL